MANKYTNNSYRKGDRIHTTGKGRTEKWGTLNFGTVLQVLTGHSVEVLWEGCNLFTDEMELSEIEREEAK